MLAGGAGGSDGSCARSGPSAGEGERGVLGHAGSGACETGLRRVLPWVRAEGEG